MIDTKELILEKYLTAIEEDLEQAVRQKNEDDVRQLYDMLRYHMGWGEDIHNNPTRGKRIRPLLVLLICSAAGGDWENALPAAAAVELVHNFSLIHDDIQDHSTLRRGRKTVWKKWGIAQAINAGDAMFTLAHLQLIRLNKANPQLNALHALFILQEACLRLTHGQYLDLAFEKHSDIKIDDYWLMVEGKTAALISACCELGAICALGNEHLCKAYREFGRLFGLAFQVQDDLLGIWGNAIITGKSTQSDLLTGKKTLPIIYGLSRQGKFAHRWLQGCENRDEAIELSDLLEKEGGKEYTRNKIIELTNLALRKLESMNSENEFNQILVDFSNDLVTRQS